MPHLMPSFYASISPQLTTGTTAAMISLVHLLVSGYPSQSYYQEHLALVSEHFLPQGSSQRVWLTDLTRSLRNRNYARLEQLTSPIILYRLFEISPPSAADTNISSYPGGPRHLAFAAMCALLDDLRNKARDTTWLVLRSAYRELHCTGIDPTSSSTELSPSPTVDWLCRSLVLRTVSQPLDNNMQSSELVDKWLADRSIGGEVRPKEGTPGRWIVSKLPVKS